MRFLIFMSLTLLGRAWAAEYCTDDILEGIQAGNSKSIKEFKERLSVNRELVKSNETAIEKYKKEADLNLSKSQQYDSEAKAILVKVNSDQKISGPKRVQLLKAATLSTENSTMFKKLATSSLKIAADKTDQMTKFEKDYQKALAKCGPALDEAKAESKDLSVVNSNDRSIKDVESSKKNSSSPSKNVKAE